jgi:hypothetical protein
MRHLEWRRNMRMRQCPSGLVRPSLLLQCRLLAQLGPKWSGRSCLLCPGNSDINLFCYGKGIIDLDAEVPDGAFDLGAAVPNERPRSRMVS